MQIVSLFTASTDTSLFGAGGESVRYKYVMLATVKMAMGCIATAKILLHSPDAKAAQWSLTRLPTLAEIHSVGLPRPLLKLERQRKFSMKSTIICMLTANTVAEIQISIKCCS